LRPKSDGRPAHFYTIVTRDTRDQEFSSNRQLFLTEQGYRYTIDDAEHLGLLRSHKVPVNLAASDRRSARGDARRA
ncbi:MAG TPA: hypothetical protein VF812_05490, partial [Ktedonobacterales bacterium]